MGEPSVGQALSAMSMFGSHAKWTEYDAAALQRIINKPKEYGPQFKFFLEELLAEEAPRLTFLRDYSDVMEEFCPSKKFRIGMVDGVPIGLINPMFEELVKSYFFMRPKAEVKLKVFEQTRKGSSGRLFEEVRWIKGVRGDTDLRDVWCALLRSPDLNRDQWGGNIFFVYTPTGTILRVEAQLWEEKWRLSAHPFEEDPHYHQNKKHVFARF